MVTAVMIVEILGRPAEHAREAIEKFMENLDKVKGIEVLKKDFSEPKLVEKEKDLHTCFCETEFTSENMSQLVDIMFDFMPSSIEILDPPRVSLESSEATSLLNGISGRLHRYDDIVKIVQNREKSMINDIKIARKLLIDNKIIDEQGKILVGSEPAKKEGEKKKD